MVSFPGRHRLPARPAPLNILLDHIFARGLQFSKREKAWAFQPSILRIDVNNAREEGEHAVDIYFLKLKRGGLMRRFLAMVLFGFVLVQMPDCLWAANEPYLLTVQQLKAGLDKAANPGQKGFLLIDVRTPQEHQDGFIPGTDTNIDFREIQGRHQELRATPEDHIVVYCQTGHRSNIAAETLIKLGYQHVYNVAGSMSAWEDAGFPIQYPR